MAITIGATSFSDMLIAAQGTVGAYWLSSIVNSGKYSLEKIKAPAQSGFKVKRHGFAGREFTFDVLIVQATRNACTDYMATFETANINKKINIVAGGVTYADCELSSWEVISGPKVCETGKFLFKVNISCEQMRIS